VGRAAHPAGGGSNLSRGPEQQRLTPVQRANLVAYLDGELSEVESRVIATKLSHSVTARRELESLEKTWELLEYLPRPSPPENFTERTLTAVQALDLAGGRWETALKRSVQGLGRVGLWVVAWLLAFGLGAAVTRFAWPNPTDRLARNLSLAEHLDEYRDVTNHAFLQELADSPEFGVEHED
jgi:anti-sigma factor RsiW